MTRAMKLLNSASEQNMYYTYICQVENNDVASNFGPNHSKPSLHDMNSQERERSAGNTTTRVEKSKALHELVEVSRKMEEDSCYRNNTDEQYTKNVTIPSDRDDSAEHDAYSPNILRLTRMKWLTDGYDESPDASPPSLLPTGSSSNIEEDLKEPEGSDRCLSTILRLDREHNLFGLSNITIVGSKFSRKARKDEKKPVFHQTAIVQVCYRQCCRYKSNSDLPASLKCNRCHNCCYSPACSKCATPCTNPHPCGHSCRNPCPAPMALLPCVSKCAVECSYGLQVKVNRKPKYEPVYVELTPRSSSVLQKPFAARSCHHVPRCQPPSSCCPYLMPCFWPARPAAPCSEPARCFHHPPCPIARKPKACVNVGEKCPHFLVHGQLCEDSKKHTKCKNLSCIGYNNEALKKALASRFGKTKAGTAAGGSSATNIAPAKKNST